MKKEVLFIFGDRHFPKQDKRIDNIIFNIVKDIKPNYIIDLGDGINADCLSNFDKSSAESVGRTLQQELQGDSIFRQRLHKLSPKSTKILLKCNHFSERIKKLEKKLYFLEGLKVWRQEVLQDLTNWQLREDFVYKNQVLFIHGDGGAVGSNKNPINKVRSLVKENNLSVVQGHSHCSGVEYHNIQGKIRFACQVGTSYDLRKAVKYIKNSKYMINWSNSILIITYLKDKKIVIPELVSINDGVAFYNNKIYRGVK